MKCECCLEGGGGNKGCGANNNANPAPICTAYGTNGIGVGDHTCSAVTGSNAGGSNTDIFVSVYFFI